MDPHFQVGTERKSRWNLKQMMYYIQSVLLDSAPMSFILIDIETSYKNAVESGNSNDTIKYFKDLLDQGYIYISVDGNNRSISLTEFALGNVPILSIKEGYELGDEGVIQVKSKSSRLGKGLNDKIVRTIMNRELVITTYTDILSEDASDLFRRVNTQVKLTKHQLRQSYISFLADWIRKQREVFYDALSKLFTEDSLTILNGDEYIAKCVSYASSDNTTDIALDNMYRNPSSTLNTLRLKSSKSKFVNVFSNMMKQISKHGVAKLKSQNAFVDLFKLAWQYEKSNTKIRNWDAFYNEWLETTVTLSADIHKMYPSIAILKDGSLSEEIFNYKKLLSRTIAKEDISQYRQDILKSIFEEKLITEKVLVQTEDDNNRFFTHDQKVKLWQKQKGICPITKKKIEFKDLFDYTMWHADHKKPYIDGGETILENGQLICATENLKKGSK